MNDNKALAQKGWFVMLLAVISTLLWGSAFPMIKIGYECFGITAGSPFDKIVFAGYRFVAAGLLTILITSVLTKKVSMPKKENLLSVIFLGVLLTGIHYVFFYLGLGNTTGTKSAIITGAATFFMVIFGAMVFKGDPITPRKTLGCVLGFAGVILINWSAGTEMSFTLSGDGFMLTAAVIFAVGNTISKVLSRKEDSGVITGWQLLAGGFFLVIVGLFGGGTLQQITAKGVIVFIYLALLSVVAYTLWTYLLQNNPVSRVSVYFFLNPAFGVVLSGVLLHEDVFNLKNMISLIIVCIGIVIVNSGDRKTKAE